jgi:hypothetical protein
MWVWPFQAALSCIIPISVASVPTHSLPPHAFDWENQIYDALAPRGIFGQQYRYIGPAFGGRFNATFAVARSGLALVSLAEVEPSVPLLLA